MGGKQLGFSDYEQSTTKKRTKREKFLAEMEQVVPWQALADLIESCYLKTCKKGGRPPYPLATMLRIHLMQQWYSHSDPGEDFAIFILQYLQNFFLIPVARNEKQKGLKCSDRSRLMAEHLLNPLEERFPWNDANGAAIRNRESSEHRGLQAWGRTSRRFQRR